MLDIVSVLAAVGLPAVQVAVSVQLLAVEALETQSNPFSAKEPETEHVEEVAAVVFASEKLPGLVEDIEKPPPAPLAKNAEPLPLESVTVPVNI